MRGRSSIWLALSLAFGLAGPSQAFAEGGCLIIEIPINPQSVAGDAKASVGEATSSVHPRAKKAQRRAPQLDDTQLKAFILEQSAPAYCGGARIVEGDEAGQYVHTNGRAINK
jgi:hypothetical protein